MELGPGLLLFPQKPRLIDRPSSVAEAIGLKPRRRRLPKAPPEHLRWRVLSAEGTVLTNWIPEITARVEAHDRGRGSGRIVETWDDFVAWHRKTYPPAPRKKRSRVATVTPDL